MDIIYSDKQTFSESFKEQAMSIKMSIKMLEKPAIGEIHHAGQELDNAVDKLAVKVVQNNETVDHLPCEYSRILWLSHVEKKLLQTPMRRNGDSL